MNYRTFQWPNPLRSYATSYGTERRIDLSTVVCRSRPNLSGIDPESVAIVRLFNPRTDRWEDHFARLLSGVTAGRTPAGRATIAVLAMNRNGRPRLRAANP